MNGRKGRRRTKQTPDLVLSRDPRAGEIVGVELEGDLVTGRELEEIEADLAGSPGHTAVPVGQLDTVCPVCEDLGYRAFDADVVAGRHVRISGSPSVMRTVCSK